MKNNRNDNSPHENTPPPPPPPPPPVLPALSPKEIDNLVSETTAETGCTWDTVAVAVDATVCEASILADPANEVEVFCQEFYGQKKFSTTTQLVATVPNARMAKLLKLVIIAINSDRLTRDADFRTLRTDISTVQKSVTDGNTDLQKLILKSLDGVNDGIKTLSQNITGLRTDIRQIKGSINSVNNDLNALRTDTTALAIDLHERLRFNYEEAVLDRENANSVIGEVTKEIRLLLDHSHLTYNPVLPSFRNVREPPEFASQFMRVANRQIRGRGLVGDSVPGPSGNRDV
ncbi:hypothetical protein SCHPADRAFT_947557 [Schizopora paradoxa]|uniref:Uncharacterized protein n=1 Tax=Schizopora paradoxa TaxID=27342 RepID=A0A0H2RIF5_9AGAM|nr:hypothetical protein SCHPADRAFT_947557 [Schizopora paradoxa]